MRNRKGNFISFLIYLIWFTYVFFFRVLLFRNGGPTGTAVGRIPRRRPDVRQGLPFSMVTLRLCLVWVWGSVNRVTYVFPLNFIIFRFISREPITKDIIDFTFIFSRPNPELWPGTRLHLDRVESVIGVSMGVFLFNSVPFFHWRLWTPMILLSVTPPFRF